MCLVLLSERATYARGNISLVATDRDDTVTPQGKLTAPLFEAFETLAGAKICVGFVTDPSAGLVLGLKADMLVRGPLAEKSGRCDWAENESPDILTLISNFTPHRQQLAPAFERLKTKFPQITESVLVAFWRQTERSAMKA